MGSFRKVHTRGHKRHIRGQSKVTCKIYRASVGSPLGKSPPVMALDLELEPSFNNHPAGSWDELEMLNSKKSPRAPH